MPDIILNDNHEYFVSGNRVLGVTEILEKAGLIDDTWFTESTRARGEAVHLACHYLDDDDLDWDTVEGEYKPYVEAYKKFLTECKPKWTQIEYKIHNKLYNYCGTFDRFGHLFENYSVLDIKTGLIQPWAALQLAAYAEIMDLKVRTGLVTRYGLNLKKNGTYKLVEYNDRQDIEVFRAALTLVKWKERNEK